ncbi:MAG TPA: hypothetical protein DCY25_10755 [Bacteroidales bacterium]|nr:hypothetical protein [Bacteroidales bacterium]
MAQVKKPNIKKGSPIKSADYSWYILAGFFVIAFVYFLVPGNYVLFFQEQQSLFVYTRDYILDFFLKPGSVADLAAKFLTQFYISSFAGSLILAVVLSMPGVLMYYVNRRLIPGSGLAGLLAVIPSCLLLIMQTHYYHLMLYNVGFVIVIAFFLIIISQETIRNKYIALAFFPLVFYVTGAFALVFIGMFIVYCLVYLKGRHRFLLPLMLAGLTGVSILLFDNLLLLQSIKQLFLYPLPFINDQLHKVIFYALIAYMVLYPALARMAGSVRLVRPGRRIAAGIVIPALVLCAAVIVLVSAYNSQTARVINLEKMIFAEKYDEAVEYHEKKPTENLIGQYFYNIALSSTGQLCDRLFHGRQDFGTSSLFLPWSSEHINWGAWSFYSIGLINEAQRWAYEEMVVYGRRPQNMKLLVKSSLINGDYILTRKYAGILKKSLFYRKWAISYEKLAGDSLAVKSDPALGRKMSILPGKDFFVFLESPEGNLPRLVNQNPGNREAFEYLMAWLLLNKDVEMLVGNISLMKDMGYTSIPRHIEEAILIYYNSQGRLPDMGGLELSSETRLRFDQYFSAFMTGRQNPATLEGKMREQFGNTFWYYFHFK